MSWFLGRDFSLFYLCGKSKQIFRGFEMKNVVLLGATGSIGTSSVDVIQQHSDIFNLYAVQQWFESPFWFFMMILFCKEGVPEWFLVQKDLEIKFIIILFIFFLLLCHAFFMTLPSLFNMNIIGDSLKLFFYAKSNIYYDQVVLF